MCRSQIKVVIPKDIVIYKNTPWVERRFSVFIDVCLVKEIEALWQEGVQTLGCCCGHDNQWSSWIGVEDSSIKKMRKLGYVNTKEKPERMDLFYPKEQSE